MSLRLINPMSDVGPKMTSAEVAAYFDGFGLAAPRSLVELLAEHNGGRPERREMVIADHWEGRDELDSVWGIGHPDARMAYRDLLVHMHHYTRKGFLPFGFTAFSGVVAVMMSGERVGEVRYLDIAAVTAEEPGQESWRLADDVVSFLNGLKLSSE